VLEQLIQVDAVVYGIGSLYTSICPSLVPCGVGEAIAVRSCPKILILNTTHDRETAGMTASAFVVSICDALNRKYCNDPCLSLQHKPSAYVSVMLVPAGGEIPVDMETLTGMGINHVVWMQHKLWEFIVVCGCTSTVMSLKTVSSPHKKVGPIYHPYPVLQYIRV
jgi:2-phospho-L-lactate transferase/gluconeogenesis factor (CofD/UPF0052 family)